MAVGRKLLRQAAQSLTVLVVLLPTHTTTSPDYNASVFYMCGSLGTVHDKEFKGKSYKYGHPHPCIWIT